MGGYICSDGGLVFDVDFSPVGNGGCLDSSSSVVVSSHLDSGELLSCFIPLIDQ